jgi:hypothetical protein
VNDIELLGSRTVTHARPFSSRAEFTAFGTFGTGADATPAGAVVTFVFESQRPVRHGIQLDLGRWRSRRVGVIMDVVKVSVDDSFRH